MPATEIAPRPLAAWLQQLEPRQLPVDAAVRNATLELLADGASAAAVAPLMLDDPALVLLLFREANRALARHEREAHTLEHAISLLGVGRTQELLQQAGALTPDHPHGERYRLALLRSRHAAAQARLWAEGTGLWPAEEVFWSTLLAAAPVWLLQLEAGDALHRLELHYAGHGAVGRALVLELLGCDIAELGAALAGRWLLPEMSQLSWQRRATGSLRQWIALEHSAHLDDAPTIPSRELTELCHHPALVVALANALATSVDWDWYSRRSERLLRIAASVCRRPLATLINYCHQTAATFSRSIDTPLPTPASRLLCRWQQAHIWFKPVPPAPAATIAAAPKSAEQTLAEAIRKLRSPTALSGMRETLELGMQALHQGAGFRRVAILLVRPGSRELQTVLSVGAGQNPALRQFRYAASNSQLLTQLLSKPVCLLIDAGNRAKYWPHLPQSLRAAIPSETFALMTVFAGERPLAMVYADNAPDALVAGSRPHTLFKQLCQQLSQTLGRLG